MDAGHADMQTPPIHKSRREDESQSEDSVVSLSALEIVR